VRDKPKIIWDERHPIDPDTGAEVWTGITQGFQNLRARMRVQDIQRWNLLNARLENLDFTFVQNELEYYEREIQEVFVAWGSVRESVRRLKFYFVVGTIHEREWLRWKVFQKISWSND
jgi:hypothetical protein